MRFVYSSTSFTPFSPFLLFPIQCLCVFRHHNHLKLFYFNFFSLSPSIIFFPSLPFFPFQVFSFRFITLFTSLYYYAFFTSDHEGALVRISVTIFSLITVGQWWGALIDICYPTIVHRALMYNMKVRPDSLYSIPLYPIP